MATPTPPWWSSVVLERLAETSFAKADGQRAPLPLEPLDHLDLRMALQAPRMVQAQHGDPLGNEVPTEAPLVGRMVAAVAPRGRVVEDMVRLLGMERHDRTCTPTLSNYAP